MRRPAQLRPGPEADADGRQVQSEIALVIVPEQRRPGDLPVPRQLGGKPVPAQRPQPVPHPHARPARQPGQVENGRGRAAGGIGRAAANQAELRLVVLSAAVLRALTLVRADFLLPIYPSLDAALAPEAAPEPELPAPALAGGRGDGHPGTEL